MFLAVTPAQAGIHLSAPEKIEERIPAVYGALPRTDCGTYAAYLETATNAVSAFYVVGGRVWGFSLLRPGLPVCR